MFKKNIPKINWIKGFDRIIFISILPTFIFAALMVFYEFDYRESSIFFHVDDPFLFLRNENPEYQKWYKQHGDLYKKHIETYYKGRIRRVDPPKYPVSPPNQYLTIPVSKRIGYSILIAAVFSILLMALLCGSTRLIIGVVIWIFSGFKT